MLGNNNPKKEVKLKTQAIQKPQSKCINKNIRFNTMNNNNFFIISVKLMNNEKSICLCLASLLVRLNIFPSRYNFVEFMDCCIDWDKTGLLWHFEYVSWKIEAHIFWLSFLFWYLDSIKLN